jgi:hypothetical protein
LEKTYRSFDLFFNYLFAILLLAAIINREQLLIGAYYIYDDFIVMLYSLLIDIKSTNFTPGGYRMRRINPGSVVSYIRYGNIKIPKNIQCECPGCRKVTEFMLNANYQNSKNSLITECTCPTCKKPAVFIIMTKDDAGELHVEHADTYIYDMQALKHPIHQIENLPNVPKDLIRAYRSAINVYLSKENAATAVMSKRVIESILKHFLNEKSKGQPLAQQLEILPNHLDLAKPIQALSLLLKQDGSLNRMLELDLEMDTETTTLLMDLLENLIDYLFVLPGKIEIAQNKIAKKLN